jgi:GNAT superfamily N-acetyltransferase
MGQDTPPEDPSAPGGPGDLNLIARLGPEASDLFAALHAESFDAPWPADDFERLLASSGVVGLVLENAGAPSGLALIRTVAGECEILTIAIARRSRRAGLGRQLLTACEDAARGAGARRLFLEVSEANIGRDRRSTRPQATLRSAAARRIIATAATPGCWRAAFDPVASHMDRPPQARLSH